MDLYDTALWNRFTIPQLRGELRNQGVFTPKGWLKHQYVALVIQTLREQQGRLQPFTAPVNEMLTRLEIPETRTASPETRTASPERGNALERLLAQLQQRNPAPRPRTQLRLPIRRPQAPQPAETTQREAQIPEIRLTGLLHEPPTQLRPPAATAGTRLEPLPEIIQEVFREDDRFARLLRAADPVNPYTLMTANIRMLIAQERDVDATTAAALAQIDEILPDWHRTIAPGNVATLTMGQLYYLGARVGINYNQLPHLPQTRKELATLIALWPLCTQLQPTPAPRPVEVGGGPVTMEQAYEWARTGRRPTIIHPRQPPIMRELDRQDFYQYPPRVSWARYRLLAITPRSELVNIIKARLQQTQDALAAYTDEELRFILSRCYLPPDTPERQQLQARINRISTAAEDVRRVLFTYHVVNTPAAYAALPVDPMDEFIYAVDTTPVPQLAVQVGMIIPPTVTNPREYYLNNVTEYFRIFGRNPQLLQPLTVTRARAVQPPTRLLAQYTDEEIIRGLGAYVNYQSRENLLAQYSSLLGTGQLFFIPFERGCVNEYTLLGTQTNDPTQFVVAFGNLNNYMCYDPEEFLMVFTRVAEIETGAQGDFAFVRPENRAQAFTREQVLQLAALAPLFPEQLEPVRARIAEGIAMLEMQNRIAADTRRDFLRIAEPYRGQIREIFLQLFYTGMYMRRWGGPGCPYPLKRQATERRVLPDPEVLAALVRVREMLDALPRNVRQYIWDLPALEYRSGDYNREVRTIGYYITEVGRGAYCIRMASSKFITTGYAYLLTLLNETIADFDIREMELVMFAPEEMRQ